MAGGQDNPVGNPADRAFMAMALSLGRRGLGTTAPNPSVGCVLVKDGIVVGRGWTQPGGRPHAEVEALRRAGDAARGATAYVTLEPCDHQGVTGPCSVALIEAGVARVVVGTGDPDPRVAGKGIVRLMEAGIDVQVGVMETEALALNQGFFQRIEMKRPLVTLKIASTLDGRIATHTGASRWITGPEARARGHLLRASHDAILIGSGTALADDPELTCRVAGLEGRSPIRIVVDGNLRLPLTAKMVRTAQKVPTWIMVREHVDSVRRNAFADCGVKLIPLPPDADGNLDLSLGFAALAEMGITRVLAEGGGRLASVLLSRGLVDRIAWFRAGRLIGGDGVPAVAAMGLDEPDDGPRLELEGSLPVGRDLLETYRVIAPGG